MAQPEAKRPRVGASSAAPPSGMPAELRETIEKSLAELGEVDYRTKSHKKRPGPVGPRCLAPEDLIHEKVETIRRGTGNRVHFKCCNANCEEPIRNDRWDTHVLKMTSDRHLQEAPEEVLERSMNFAPDGEWDTQESRMQRVLPLRFKCI